MVLPQVFTVISLWSIFPTSAEEGFRGVVLLEEACVSMVVGFGFQKTCTILGFSSVSFFQLGM